MTLSTRKGESGVFVSITEPTVVYPSLAIVGVRARAAIGSSPRPSASSKTPITCPKSVSPSSSAAAAAGSRRT